MSKPTNLLEKRRYQRIVYLDLDRLVYLEEDVDPFTYLEDYPNNRVIPIYTVRDNTAVSGLGMNPEEFPTILKDQGELYRIGIDKLNKKIKVHDNNNSEIYSIGKQTVISQALTGGNNYFLSSSSSSYEVVSTLIFRGSDLLGVPSSITCTVGQTSDVGQLRIYDETNAKTIAEETTSLSEPHTIEFSNIENVSSSLSNWEIQLRVVSGKKNKEFRIYSIEICF